MLPIDLYTKDLPAVLERFAELIGERHWVRRVDALIAEAKGRPYLRQYVGEDNVVAFSLALWSALRESGEPVNINDRSLYPAFRVAAQALAIIDNSSPERGAQFIRRIHGAIRNPDGLRALEFEFSIAAHFLRRGYEISWPEMESSGAFDILVHSVGSHGVEVECKSIERDKGMKIHRREALILNHLVQKRVEHISRRLASGLAVVLTVPDRLLGDPNVLRRLADEVRDAVLIGKSVNLGDGSDIRLLDFNIANFPNLGPPMSRQVREAIDTITGTQNREAMILGKKGGGALVFVAQSRENDNMVRYVFKSVGDGARRQLSKKRAGLILVGLQGISADELVETAHQDGNPEETPTALRLAVSEFLNGESTDHVVGVGFISKDRLTDMGGGHIKSEGIAYHFPKTKSTFWHDDFAGLFEARG